MTTAAERREWYRVVYLKSPRWRVLRWLRRRMDGNRCRMCKSGQRLEVHHRSYQYAGAFGLRNFVRELNDLTTLCATCHGRHHNRR